MKTLLTSFLTLLFSSVSVSLYASDIEPQINIGMNAFDAWFCFDSGYPVSYAYATGTDPEDVCIEPLVKNEVFRILLVRDKRIDYGEWSTPISPAVNSAVQATLEPAVAIDAAGQVVCSACGTVDFTKHTTLKNGSECAGNVLGAKWADIMVWSTEESKDVPSPMITVGSSEGVPGQTPASLGGYHGFRVIATTTAPGYVEGEESAIYAYLVALDTRDGMGECKGETTHVVRYAMTLCHYNEYTIGCPEDKFSPRNYYVLGETGFIQGAGQILDYPGHLWGWQPCAEIKSLAVDGVEKTGEALKKYLTPEIAALGQATEDGKTVLTLTATAPDVQYYTLYTKAKLSDASWMPFEKFVNEDENFVDKTIGKRYTRFRIDGKSLSIPVISGETSRFYQLRGE